MDLSIIMVNYATYDLTRQAVESVINSINAIDYEIIVVDNNSPDDSLQKLEDYFKEYECVKFVANEYNGGFAVANNSGCRQAQGDYLLLLNSDIIIKGNAINDCLTYLKENDNIGVIGCKVSLPDGRLDKACRRSFPTPTVSFYRLTGLSKIFPKSRRFNQYNMSYLDDDGVYMVDSIVGAFMLLTRKLYDECGGLSESYFMYGEDIELCYDVKQLGYDVCYYGKAEIIHYKGGSGSNKRLLYEFHKSMEIFYDKHYKKENNTLVNLMVHAGIWALYYLKLLKLKLISH